MDVRMRNHSNSFNCGDNKRRKAVLMLGMNKRASEEEGARAILSLSVEARRLKVWEGQQSRLDINQMNRPIE